ncbi:MAG: hypothetical protein ABEI06_05375 [Halobacteriaceae archaeon]
MLAGGIAIANHIPATAPYQRSLKYVYIGLLWGWLAIQSLSNLNEWRKEHTLSSLDATAKAMAELSLFDWTLSFLQLFGHLFLFPYLLYMSLYSGTKAAVFQLAGLFTLVTVFVLLFQFATNSAEQDSPQKRQQTA